jgi:hypothetical protein
MQIDCEADPVIVVDGSAHLDDRDGLPDSPVGPREDVRDHGVGDRQEPHVAVDVAVSHVAVEEFIRFAVLIGMLPDVDGLRPVDIAERLVGEFERGIDLRPGVGVRTKADIICFRA